MRFGDGWSIATVVLAAPLAAGSVAVPPSPAAAAPLSSPAFAAPGRTPDVLPVVVFGAEARQAPKAFAQTHGLDAAEVARSHVASGLVQCGNAHGAGQLTLTDEVITTAAHVFYDENGLPRARTCSFDVTINGRESHVPIDLGSVVAGSTNPYDEEVTRDWAVARLSHPLSGVSPYMLAGADVMRAGEPTTFVARGHIDWGGARDLSMQDCTMRDKILDGAEGTREFAFDCDTGDGASGGALMLGGERSRVGAILVGWRSNRPFKAMPYSARTHYNFAVTIEGAFRRAVYAAAGQLIVQK